MPHLSNPSLQNQLYFISRRINAKHHELKTIISLELLNEKRKRSESWNLILYQIIYSLPQMKYLAAYALLALSGKKDIKAADIKSLLGNIGSQVCDEDVNRCIDSLKGKPLHELIAKGQKKLGSSAGPAAPAEAKKDKKQQKKKEEPKKKQAPPPPKEEEAEEDLGDLFG